LHRTGSGFWKLCESCGTADGMSLNQLTVVCHKAFEEACQFHKYTRWNWRDNKERERDILEVVINTEIIRDIASIVSNWELELTMYNWESPGVLSSNEWHDGIDRVKTA